MPQQSADLLRQRLFTAMTTWAVATAWELELPAFAATPIGRMKSRPPPEAM
jgi:hypothetical protein